MNLRPIPIDQYTDPPLLLIQWHQLSPRTLSQLSQQSFVQSPVVFHKSSSPVLNPIQWHPQRGFFWERNCVLFSLAVEGGLPFTPTWLKKRGLMKSLCSHKTEAQWQFALRNTSTCAPGIYPPLRCGVFASFWFFLLFLSSCKLLLGCLFPFFSIVTPPPPSWFLGKLDSSIRLPPFPPPTSGTSCPPFLHSPLFSFRFPSSLDQKVSPCSPNHPPCFFGSIQVPCLVQTPFLRFSSVYLELVKSKDL